MNTNTGYVFNFQGKAFSPNGKVEMSPDQIEEHNSRLATLELEQMKQTGRALLYLFTNADKSLSVGTWASEPFQRSPVLRSKTSFHNMAGKDGRTDVWFRANGESWHGVNIGDNDIVRCKRIKKEVPL